jgi:hypothetical protein
MNAVMLAVMINTQISRMDGAKRVVSNMVVLLCGLWSGGHRATSSL